jgi:16S rRNA (guanine527-N7)-methyltransferase
MPPEGIAAVAAIVPVSRETAARLEAFVALVGKWQRAENLVGPAALKQIWTRHVADSAQLLPLFPGARRWLDLGSGAGFPGMVIAILLAGRGVVHLVESNGRKCAFLRAAARETGAPAEVHQGRIEDILAAWSKPVEVITARALAPLGELLRLTWRLIRPERPAAFLKGADYRNEIAEASQSFALDLVVHASRISDGVILEVRGAAPKGMETPD